MPAAAGEVAEAVGGREHDERDVDVAEDGELVGLLDEAVAALGEGDLPVGGVLDPLDLQLHAPHGRRRRVAEAVGGGSGEPASEVKEEEPPAAKQASSCGAAPYALSPPSRRDEAVQPRTPRGGGRRRPGPGHAAALVARSSMAATPHLRSYAHGSAPVRTCVSPRYWP